MKIVVIGASGHVGGYLVPALVGEGHQVVAVSRGRHRPYREDPAWERVEQVVADREADDESGGFAARIADLDADVVVDLICFTEASAGRLVEALRGRVRQLVHIGTIWVNGYLTQVPATEDEPRRPWGEYGTQKAAIERLLLDESRRPGGLPVAIVHPGHITGPGWPIIGPQGTVDVAVWRTLATGGELVLPGFGLETVHHVHAADVAQLVGRCIAAPERANGEAFYAVSPRAVTMRGLAEAAAGWFGRDAVLRFAPFDEFAATLASDEFRSSALDHVARSPSLSIEKAHRLLGYAPAYTSLQAVAEAVEWLRADGRLGDGIPPVRVAAAG